MNMSNGYPSGHAHNGGHVHVYSPFLDLKRQVWIKLRPTSKYQDSVISANPDGKTLELAQQHQQISSLPFKFYYKSPPPALPILRSFVSDGILENCSHEDTFEEIGKDVIEKAMNGTSGVILSLGPQGSGKSYTFYGDLEKYESRGLLPRSFEKIFQYAEIKSRDMRYTIHLGIIDIRKDKIRDLISLSPQELKTVGDDGPNGMLLHPITCAEHGLLLLLRALAGQKLLSRYEEFAKYHMIIYIDIDGEGISQEEELENDSQIKFHSRITFAKIAPIPQRGTGKFMPTPAPSTLPNEKIIRSNDCFYITPVRAPLPTRPSTAWNPMTSSRVIDDGGSARGRSPFCCSMKSGLFGETISIRRDLLFLEQMFIRVSELRKLNRYYHKLKFLGMEGIMRKPNLTPSQYFRQSKLCHCLQDLVCSNNEVRILIHLRPELEFLPTVLTSLRFAERLRSIPTDLKSEEFKLTGDKMTDLKLLRKEIKTLREELDHLSKSARELADDNVELSPSHLNILQNQASEYIDGKIEKLDVGSKAEAKALFENFRTLYQSSREKKEGQEGDDKEKASKNLKSKKNKNLDQKKQNQRTKETQGKNQRTNTSKKNRKSKKASREAESTEETKDELVQPETEVKVEEVKATKIDEEEEQEEEELPTVAYEEKDESHEEALEEIHPKIEFASRDEALIQFANTEIGNKLSQDLGNLEAQLEKMTVEHGETLRVASDLVKEISSKQVEFDTLQQERHVKGDEYDLSGNVIVSKREKDLLLELRGNKDSRDEILEGVKHKKHELYKVKKEIDEAKVNYELQFQNFCLEQYSLIYEESQECEEAINDEFLSQMRPPENEEFCNLFTIQTFEREFGESISNNFNELKRIAQEQARAILKHYRTKPKWRYY